MATISTGSSQGDLGAYSEPVDGRIWFVGDYTRRFDNNKAGQSGVEVATSIAESICDECKDDPTWERVVTFNGNTKTKDCKYVANKPEKRCNKSGFLNGVGEKVKAFDACPVACNTCKCFSN